jgi:hypothetical protein
MQTFSIILHSNEILKIIFKKLEATLILKYSEK